MSTEAMKEEDRTGPITDDEAVQIARRYNASHFRHHRDMCEHARYSIPADPRRDDDIRLGAYISQTRQLRAENTRLRSALERLAKTVCPTCRRDADARAALTPSPRDGGR